MCNRAEARKIYLDDGTRKRTPTNKDELMQAFMSKTMKEKFKDDDLATLDDYFFCCRNLFEYGNFEWAYNVVENFCNDKTISIKNISQTKNTSVQRHCFLQIALSCQSDIKKKITRIEEKSFGCSIKNQKNLLTKTCQRNINNSTEVEERQEYIPVQLESSNKKLYLCMSKDVPRSVEN